LEVEAVGKAALLAYVGAIILPAFDPSISDRYFMCRN
jgi:hypothetical protein